MVDNCGKIVENSSVIESINIVLNLILKSNLPKTFREQKTCFEKSIFTTKKKNNFVPEKLVVPVKAEYISRCICLFTTKTNVLVCTRTSATC